MMLQQKISKELNSKKMGKIYKVLVEGFNGKTYMVETMKWHQK